MTIHVPFRVVTRGGPKEMRLAQGAVQPRERTARWSMRPRPHRAQSLTQKVVKEVLAGFAPQ